MHFQVDLSHVKGLLNASSTTGVEMDMKEFSHTNDLIENAEEWMARVREVLESGEPATLHSLEALLAEAESIPVTMDEQQLLTVGIKARQWRLHVDGTLASGKAKIHELQELVAKVSLDRFAVPGCYAFSLQCALARCLESLSLHVTPVTLVVLVLYPSIVDKRDAAVVYLGTGGNVTSRLPQRCEKSSRVRGTG